jgi:hypothetical protein
MAFFVRAALIAGAAIVFFQVRNWLRWRALKKWGEQHGCGDAPEVENQLPGGIERYSILFTGMKSTYNAVHRNGLRSSLHILSFRIFDPTD